MTKNNSFEKNDKIRLDQLVSAKYPEYSRSQAQQLILAGRVLVNNQVMKKASLQLDPSNTVLEITASFEYVCRAGEKLAAALNEFEIDVRNFVVLDAGLSTGGFTDCLLQHGAQRVYGVDVGHDQVHDKIRADSRVVVMEKINLRYLAQLPELVDLVTLDLSFISILKVIEAVHSLLKPGGKLIALIKPQFEAGPEDVPATGVILSSTVHERVMREVQVGIEAAGFTFQRSMESPLLGGSGNKEFLGYFIKK